MDRSKIFQVIPNLNIGGAEIMVENLVSVMHDKGMNVSVVTFYDDDSSIAERLINKGIRIYNLKKRKGVDLLLIFKNYQVFFKRKTNCSQYSSWCTYLCRICINFCTCTN